MLIRLEATTGTPTCSAERAADADEGAVGHRGDDGRHPGLVPADAGVEDGGTGVFDFGCQREDFFPGLAVLDIVGQAISGRR